jgi:threonine-phosphate decarboxylase
MIYQLAKVLKPKKVMVMAPTFSEYELAAESVGAEIEYFFLKAEADFQLDLKKLESSLTKELDLLFLCNPNNPTAQLIKASKLENLIKKAAQKKITVVIDEAFIDFLAQPEIYSVVNLLAKYDNLLILKSMTKLFAIPALRLGYALTNKELSQKLENNRDPWSVNYFSQLAGEIIFKEDEEIKEYIKRSKKKIVAEREYLYNQLKKIKKLKVYPPTTNYIFIDLSASKYEAKELRKKLAKSAILIRSCDSYRGLNKNYIRVAVKSRKENNILLKKLKELFN